MSWLKIKREIFLAIERNEINKVMNILEENPKALYAYNVSGESLLHVAANFGNIHLLEVLTKKGLDVNINLKNEYEKKITPLHNAVENSCTESVKWLIDHGADVNAGEGLHATPLISAVLRGHEEIATLLVNSGANLNAIYTMGDGTEINALKAAKMKEHNKLFDLLLQWGAKEINDEASINNRPYNSRHSEIVNYIAKFFGSISNTIGEITPGGNVSIEINIIPPSNDKKFYTLFTCGMSDLPMDESVDAENKYAELLLKLPSNWPIHKLEDKNNRWPIGWLKKLAYIPHEFNGWIDEGVIIPYGEPPRSFASNTELSCFMITRPTEPGLDKLHLSDGSIVNIYSIVPIYSEERDLAIEYGFEYLIKKLQELGEYEVLDINRGNIGIN